MVGSFLCAGSTNHRSTRRKATHSAWLFATSDRTGRIIQDGCAATPKTGEQAPSAVRLACRVLLAEDGQDNQRLISFVLKKAGAEVTLAENGRIACQKALDACSPPEPGDEDENAAKGGGAAPYDVVLMDMQMPVMDGYAAAGELRKAGYTGPIIALTAHAMRHDQQKCLDAGCDDYLAKPFERDALLAMVARYARHDATDSACSAPTAPPAAETAR